MCFVENVAELLCLTSDLLDNGKRNRQRPTKCFCNGAVTSWFKVLSSFNAIVFVGQDAASKAHHCANTNVGCNLEAIPIFGTFEK